MRRSVSCWEGCFVAREDYEKMLLSCALAEIGGNLKGGAHFAVHFKDVRVDRDVRAVENVLLSYMHRNMAEIWRGG